MAILYMVVVAKAHIPKNGSSTYIHSGKHAHFIPTIRSFHYRERILMHIRWFKRLLTTEKFLKSAVAPSTDHMYIYGLTYGSTYTIIVILRNQ